MLEEVTEATAKGATAVELRLDYLFAEGGDQDVSLETLVADVVPTLAAACKSAGVRCVATLRPRWEGGEYPCDSSGGHEHERRRVGALRALAERTDVDFIDCEMLAADLLFSSNAIDPSSDGTSVSDSPWSVPETTRLILSRHDFEKTPDDAELKGWQKCMFDLGADVAKIACKANDIIDCARMLSLMDPSGKAYKTGDADDTANADGRAKGTISLSMGEAGVMTRLLAPKFNGFLTFGALDETRASAPG